MRIRMDNFQSRPRRASAVQGFADLVFEDRSDVLRIAIQVGMAALVGVLLGTYGRAWLGF